jgi:hypothetical protein
VPTRTSKSLFIVNANKEIKIRIYPLTASGTALIAKYFNGIIWG